MQWADRIGRRIKLRDLHVFDAVAQSRSMTKAAHTLAISVPVVSKAIADLEHTIGVRLLDRNSQGVEPTIYGYALLSRSNAAFDELRQGVKDIEFLADPTAGEVRIGSTAPIAGGFVSAVIDRLSRKHPRITFHLVVAETGILHRELSDRNVDFLIARMYEPVADEHVNVETLYTDPYVVVAGMRSPWARRRTVALAELVNEPWILPPPATLLGTIVAEAFRASKLDVPRATVVTFPTGVQNSLLMTGRFLTILAESVLRFSVKNSGLKMLPVKLPLRRRPIGIITLKNRTLSPVVQMFLECARETAKPLAMTK
jgi:DNA-binding transcriptional LysR family regulator